MHRFDTEQRRRETRERIAWHAFTLAVLGLLLLVLLVTVRSFDRAAAAPRAPAAPERAEVVPSERAPAARTGATRPVRTSSESDGSRPASATTLLADQFYEAYAVLF